MRRTKLSEKFSALVIITAVLIVLGFTCELPPRTDRRLHETIGKVLARQALDLTDPAGQIIIITRDTEAFPQPAIDILLASFQKEVRRVRAHISRVQRIQVDPLRPVEVPSGDFFELMRRAPIGCVIVSFLGPPLLSEQQVAQIAPNKPKVVAFCSGASAEMIDLAHLFDNGLLHAAVISRPVASIRAARPQKVPTSFDDLYVSVTASNRAQLRFEAASAF